MSYDLDNIHFQENVQQNLIARWIIYFWIISFKILIWNWDAIWDKVIRCGKYFFQTLFGQYFID